MTAALLYIAQLCWVPHCPYLLLRNLTAASAGVCPLRILHELQSLH
ncbi:rCG45559 [Rattus norvegicus]|uniref:RCG45559 n=1 Tax=Rattus norvegicus TaxID=10116 RepID=A6JTE4_RAT|nr:rCG45559 [Rattus norvegicus]